MDYTVIFKPAAEKAIERFDRKLQRRVIERSLALAKNPRPAGCSKLAGHSNLYRLRIGDYRVVYEVQDERQTVLVAMVAHRREVYRGL